MTTSWAETQQIEKYLLGTVSGEERALFAARLLLEPELKANTSRQELAYAVIHEYGRQKLRQEIEEVSRMLFTTSKYQSFARMILGIFRK